MELDVVQIGERVRKIREENFNETREVFAERCNISENHLGKLERGQFLITTKLLNTICNVAGIGSDYLLYGKTNNKSLSIRNKIDNILDNATTGELRAFLRMLTVVKETYNLKDDLKDEIKDKNKIS